MQDASLKIIKIVWIDNCVLDQVIQRRLWIKKDKLFDSFLTLSFTHVLTQPLQLRGLFKL